LSWWNLTVFIFLDTDFTDTTYGASYGINLRWFD